MNLTTFTYLFAATLWRRALLKRWTFIASIKTILHRLVWHFSNPIGIRVCKMCFTMSSTWKNQFSNMIFLRRISQTKNTSRCVNHSICIWIATEIRRKSTRNFYNENWRRRIHSRDQNHHCDSRVHIPWWACHRGWSTKRRRAVLDGVGSMKSNKLVSTVEWKSLLVHGQEEKKKNKNENCVIGCLKISLWTKIYAVTDTLAQRSTYQFRTELHQNWRQRKNLFFGTKFHKTDL